MGYFAAPNGTVKTGGRIDLYVAADAAGASDTNPGTVAQPLLTIDEAIRRCNLYDEISGTGGNAPFVIHVASAAANYVVSATIDAHLMRSNIIIIGDGAGQVGQDGFTQLLGSTAAVAGSSSSQIVTGGGLGTNTYRGKTVIVLTGAAAGDRRTIRDHTDTTITPVRNFSAAVAATDTFRIVEPAVIATFGSAAGTPFEFCRLAGGGSISPLASTTSVTSATTPPPPGVYVINLRFSPATTNTPLRMAGSRVCFIGCELGPNTFVAGLDCCIYLGCDVGDGFAQAFIGQNTFSTTSVLSWSGWGVYSAGGFTLGNTGTVVGFLVAISTSAGALTQFGGSFVLLGGNLETSAGSVGAYNRSQGAAGYAKAEFLCGQELNIAPVILITNTNATAGIGVNCDVATAGAGSWLVKLHRTTLSTVGTLGQALLARGDVKVTIGSSVTGTSGFIGLNSSRGAITRINGAPAITGSAGQDLTVDNGTSFDAVATLAAVGDFISSADGSAISRISS